MKQRTLNILKQWKNGTSLTDSVELLIHSNVPTISQDEVTNLKNELISFFVTAMAEMTRMSKEGR